MEEDLRGRENREGETEVGIERGRGRIERKGGRFDEKALK
jgi:hypothetical protein